MKIAKNWELHYRKIYEPKIKRLTERYDKIYDENQKMKRRLQKYEASRRMTNYYNKKD
jgi:hypothetical protein